MSNGMDEVTSIGDCAGIPMDGGPVCESCGVPLVEHLGLIGTCAELQRVTAERVIARGAAVKPHAFAEIVNQVRDIANQYAGTDQLRERIAYALTPHFERNGGPTPDYTGEGSALVLPVDARAVVLEDCPRVEQTVLHVPGVSRGNYFSASVAGLLKLPIDTIPQLVTTEDESWQEQFNGWLRQFGLAWFPMAGDDLAGECQQYGISGLWSEMSGQSPRFEGGHSCVAKDGRLAWDPHPSQSGLEHPIWWHGVFIALRPWELVSCDIPADPATEVVVSRDGLDDLREQLRTAKADLVQTRLSCQRMPHEVAEHVNALRDIATTQHWSASDLREAIEREVERFAKLGEAQK